MMKRIYILAVCSLLCLVCVTAQATLIEYRVSDIGGNQFEYEYTISNDTLSVAIEEFTIWFDVDLYDNLIITTQELLAGLWDEIILEDTGFGLPLGYDALAQADGILPTEMLAGFSVAFDWLGSGTPGPQFFEIIDPISFETIDSGYTVPEPSILLLLGLGGLTRTARTKDRAAHTRHFPVNLFFL
ncbi:MAG: PEP-CTERM sorting domain-containing protein [Sedimentisphaerales bacterium]|nr:PEP-CTERM sorting domain-containing protein [Sedimentisphaerales bacterium]